MKGKALRKHSLHEKTAASVLLKLFISCNALDCVVVNFLAVNMVKSKQTRNNGFAY